jgi:hypothetical protein
MLIQARQSRPVSNTKATLKGIPSGMAGTRATLKQMARMAQKAKRQIEFREQALAIVQNAPPKCWSCEAKLIQDWILSNIRYVRDIEGIETIATPEKTLEYRQGDCDDLVLLASVYLLSIGHPVRYVAVGFNNKPYSHVLLETLIGNRWEPMELTEPLPFGKAPPGITSKMIEHIKR